MSSLLRVANTSIRAFAVLALTLSASAQQKKEPVDYVNPNIGGIGQLLSATSPSVIMPYSVHTSPNAPREGEAQISAIRKRLAQERRL